MKNSFPEFYKLSEEEYVALWDGCIFAFDANVLLNLYRYSLETGDNLIALLKNFSDRIWIPHQFAFEYQKNRMKVIEDQRLRYMKSINSIVGELETAQSLLGYFYSEMPVEFTKLKTDLLKSRDEYPGCTSHDKVRDEVDILFKDKVGQRFSDEELGKILQEGKERYAKELPPGYCDADKKDEGDPTKTRKYGDLIGWKQMILKAKGDKKPLIFITSERKEDWWQKVSGKTVGPRHELLKEFNDETGQIFHMYDMERFLEYAKEKFKVDKKTIDEVVKVDEVYYEPLIAEAGSFILNGNNAFMRKETEPYITLSGLTASDVSMGAIDDVDWLVLPKDKDDEDLVGGS
jgi:hypothetical protein